MDKKKEEFVEICGGDTFVGLGNEDADKEEK